MTDSIGLECMGKKGSAHDTRQARATEVGHEQQRNNLQQDRIHQTVPQERRQQRKASPIGANIGLIGGYGMRRCRCAGHERQTIDRPLIGPIQSC